MLHFISEGIYLETLLIDFNGIKFYLRTLNIVKAVGLNLLLHKSFRPYFLLFPSLLELLSITTEISLVWNMRVMYKSIFSDTIFGRRMLFHPYFV